MCVSAAAGALVLVAQAAHGAPQVPEAAADIPRFLGRLHPLVVHFPIALLVAAVVFEVSTILIRGERKRPSPAGLACATAGAIGAVAAAWFGWINAELEPHGRGVAGLMEVHRWLGVATAGIAAAAVVAALVGAAGKSRVMTGLYRVALVLAAGLVAAAGHWGGTMVYGEGYLTEALFPRTVAPAPSVEDQLARLDAPSDGLSVDFATQIAPIFADHCMDCHGPAKKKGNLRLDARHFVFDERDAEEQVIVPGDAQASDLFFRVALPHDDIDAMPPEGEGEPLTAAELALLETWINEGAVWSDARLVAAAEPRTEEVPDAAPQPLVFDEAAESRQTAALEALRRRGAVATRLSEGEPWVEVRLDLLGEQIADSDLALLGGLESTLVSLNLSGTSVTDEGMGALARFPRLERLHLARTAISDAGVERLAPLQSLAYLNLYGTDVTDRTLVVAANHPKLEQLYVWNTGVSPQAAALLAALRPGMQVEAGGEFEAAVLEEEAPADDGAVEKSEDAAEAAGAADVGAGGLDPALLPACCTAALAAGGQCDHPCCVEARAAGAICEACSR